MNVENLKEKLNSVLSTPRYKHSMRVLATATELAKLYGADVNKVQIASILHDYAKELPDKELINICSLYFKDEVDSSFIKILHSFAGFYLAETELKIKDSDILNAIKYHSTGRVNMSLVEKIVYIADAIEPGRNHSGVDIIRELAYIDIDKAILLEVNRAIKYLIKKDLPIHRYSIAMRNFLLSKNKDNGGAK